MSEFKSFIATVAQGESLTRAQAEMAFGLIMAGEATPSQMGGFLMALRVRGETVDEIAGAVSAMRAKMIGVRAPAGAVDIVGTGGDGSGSLNISTLASFIVAGAGVPVAKHGNRALSSKSGAADCLTALGVRIDISPEHIARCINLAGVGFMFAPNHHPAMKHVGPTRVELGTRTAFNLLGPLSNPASVTRQMVGVYAGQWVKPLAEVLKTLGSEHVWVVNGADGMDEITGTGPTQVCEMKAGAVTAFSVSPADVGLGLCTPESLKGGDGASNAQALRAVLEGAKNPYRDVACLNAAAGLIVAGEASSLSEGYAAASAALESGRAKAALDRLISVSNAE